MKVWPGTNNPLGATYDGSGTNFSPFSEAAERVELRLFDEQGKHWGEGFAKAVGVFLNGEGIARRARQGSRVVDDSFYLLYNAHYEPLDFTLPKGEWGKQWRVVLDTREPLPQEQEEIYKPRQNIPVESRSLKVPRRVG